MDGHQCCTYCQRAPALVPKARLVLSRARLTSTGVRQLSARALCRKPQRPLPRPVKCCDGDSSSGSHSSDDSHSSHDTGLDSHASSHYHHPSVLHSSHGSDHSNHSTSNDASSSHHSDQSSNHHNSQIDTEDNFHHQGHNEKNTGEDQDDRMLDIVGMLDAGDMFSTGDNDAVTYQPSSGQYNRQPDRPKNPDFWAYKPVWCQPWSILTSGTAVVAGVRWLSGGSVIATCVAAAPILVWWYLFLVLVPADFRKYAEED